MGDVLNRFPVLAGYKKLLNIFAAFVLIVSILHAFDAATPSGGGPFDVGEFILAFFDYGFISLGLTFTAELIELGLTIEDHLYEIRASLATLVTLQKDQARPDTITQEIGDHTTPARSRPQSTKSWNERLKGIKSFDWSEG